MMVQSFLHTIDRISTWVGKLAAWLIIGLMLAVCIEVFKRYIMNMPTAWIFDLDNMLYGSLFMLCGAYTLAQNAHVRGDFLYSSMRPRTQAALLEAMEERLTGRVEEMEVRLTTDAKAMEARVTGEAKAMEDRLSEHIRDMQTEM